MLRLLLAAAPKIDLLQLANYLHTTLANRWDKEQRAELPCNLRPTWLTWYGGPPEKWACVCTGCRFRM